MKLNNKGFAFSTLLYGLLAVITLLLALIFASYKKTYDETFYYSAVMEESLNKCINQELALENCYRNGGANCNKSAYFSCLGFNDTTSTVKEVFKDRLIALSSNSSNKFKAVTGTNMAYMYQGTDVNNYVKFSGMLWRIVGITESGEIKLVLAPTSATYAWDTQDSTEWNDATIQNYLNNEFLGTIANASSIYKYSWGIGRIDLAEVDNIKKSELYGLETASTYSAKVGLLSPSDIVLSSSSTCGNTVKIFKNDVTCINTWISDTWLINSSKTAQKSAFYYDSEAKLLKHDLLTGTDDPNTHLILPAIYLNNGILSVKDVGNGTVANPYIVE